MELVETQIRDAGDSLPEVSLDGPNARVDKKIIQRSKLHLPALAS